MSITQYLNIKLGQKGFTLAEGMVTAALLGVVSLAMLQGLKEDAKTKQLMRQEDEIQAVMSEIDHLMKGSDSCLNTLQAASITKTSSGAIVSDIRNESGAVATYKVKSNGTTVSLGGISLSTPVQLQSTNLIISGVRASNFKKFFNIYSRDDSGSLAGIDTEYGVMEFQVIFTQTAQNRKVDVVRSINLTVASNTSGTITECVNPADLVALQLKEKVCGTIYDPASENYMIGSFRADTGVCDGITESIQYVGSKALCMELGGIIQTVPAPIHWRCTFRNPTSCDFGISGFKADGTPKCL